MNEDSRINYIEFQANDLERTKAFYAAAFGWKFVDYGPDYCAFNDGRLDGGFYKSSNAASVSSGSALVVLYADTLEASLNKVKQCGGTIVKDIFSFPGGRRFHFADPNGNELAMWSDK